MLVLTTAVYQSHLAQTNAQLFRDTVVTAPSIDNMIYYIVSTFDLDAAKRCHLSPFQQCT